MSTSRGLTPEQVAYVNSQRVSRFATADAKGMPHLVPLCHVATPTTIYLSNGPRGPKARRARNVRENPQAAFLVDHYSEDWDAISYIMLTGRAELLDEGPECENAVRLLKAQYEQWRDWTLEQWGVIALRVERIVTR